MNQPNPALWAKFVEAVEAGRVEGLEWNEHWGYLTVRGMMMVLDERSAEIDHLCAELRRWMEGKGIGLELVSKWGRCELRLFDNGSHDSRVFPNVTELNRHLQAALWVLERGGA